MKHLRAALAGLLSLLVISSALAQSAPARLPYHTVYGRIGAVAGDTGPGQAIPFSTLFSLTLNSLCQTNNAFPVYSTGSAAWVCSTAPSANTVYAGPATAPAAQPTFRALVGADLPTPGASSLGGTQSKTCSTSNWFNTISTSGVPGCTQPSFADLTGSIAASQLPNPSASTLGGVKSLAAISHNFLTSIGTNGLPTQAQPACADVSDATVYCNAARGQLPGETSTGSATAGNVGEYIESVIVVGSAVSQTTATSRNMTSISLTAGDWDVLCTVQWVSNGSTSYTFLSSSLSTTSATLDLTNGRFWQIIPTTAVVPGASNNAWVDTVGPLRFSVGSTTTVYCVTQPTFSAGTLGAYGILRARRMR